MSHKISVNLSKRGKAYVLRWRPNGTHGPRKSQALPKHLNKQQAEYARRKKEEELNSINAPSAPKRIMFSEWVKEWFSWAKGRLSNKGLHSQYGALKVILNVVGDRPLSQVSASMVEEGLMQRAAAGTLRLTSLASYYKWLKYAIDNHAIGVKSYLSVNPFKNLMPPKNRPHKPKPRFTSSQLCMLVQKVSELHGIDWEVAIRAQAETGMRFGEVANLVWADIDLDAGMIHLPPVKQVKDTNGIDKYVTTKTGTGRTIPISSVDNDWGEGYAKPLTERLKDWRRWCLAQDYPMLFAVRPFRHYHHRGNGPERKKSEVGQLGAEEFKRKAREIMKEASRQCGLPEITPKYLRHSRASVWVNEYGSTMADLMSIMGWTSPQTALKYYVECNKDRAAMSAAQLASTAKSGRKVDATPKAAGVASRRK